jgi:hypothetical protein
MLYKALCLTFPSSLTLKCIESSQTMQYTASKGRFCQALTFGDDPVGDIAQNVRGDVCVVHLLYMLVDVPQAVAKPVHRNDLLLQVIGQYSLPFLYNLRLKTTVTILRGLNCDFARATFDSLLTFSIPLVTRLPVPLFRKMFFHLCFQSCLQKLLPHRSKGSALS